MEKPNRLLDWQLKVNRDWSNLLNEFDGFVDHIRWKAFIKAVKNEPTRLWLRKLPHSDLQWRLTIATHKWSSFYNMKLIWASYEQATDKINARWSWSWRLDESKSTFHAVLFIRYLSWGTVYKKRFHKDLLWLTTSWSWGLLRYPFEL